MFQDAGESASYFKSSYGYAVFTTIGKAGLAHFALEAVELTPGLSTIAPRAAPFLFLGSDRGDEIAEPLQAVGLPVVDGSFFQAPGFARLPFGGATAARAALVGALDTWSELHAK